MAQQMGIGDLGLSNIVFKRKFRWTFSITTDSYGDISAKYVKIAARPSLKIETTEVNFLNSKIWVPGKGEWDDLTVTYNDVVGGSASSDMSNLYSWLAAVYDFSSYASVSSQDQASMNTDYTGDGTLTMLDGCGNTLESWQIKDMWPTTINFGDLDYNSSDIAEISLTFKYARAIYTGGCGVSVKSFTCTTCS